MQQLAKRDLAVERRVMDRTEAINFFKDQGEHYKAQIIEALPESEEISLYGQGDFVDLCRGPHVPSTGKLRVFKLLKVAGAYWRGDSNNEMLQRIYGTAWATKEDLDAYIFRLEEAEKRDHRKLGKQLDLFPQPGRGAGDGVLAPKRLAAVAASRAIHARCLPQQRLPGSALPPDSGRESVETFRALGQFSREHVFYRVRESRIRRQADELPWPRADFQ